MFLVIAAAAITGTPWLLVIGLAGHGLKDLWQHRTHFVANTRWWPPFCLVVDWLVAAVVAVEIVAGVHFQNKNHGRRDAVRFAAGRPGNTKTCGRAPAASRPTPQAAKGGSDAE